jgi:hypothetical protein
MINAKKKIEITMEPYRLGTADVVKVNFSVPVGSEYFNEQENIRSFLQNIGIMEEDVSLSRDELTVFMRGSEESSYLLLKEICVHVFGLTPQTRFVSRMYLANLGKEVDAARL